MMMIWIIPAVVIGGLVIGTVIYSIMKTNAPKENETTIAGRRGENDWEMRKRTPAKEQQHSQKTDTQDAIKFCTNCGVRIKDTNNQFCPNCGNPLI